MKIINSMAIIILGGLMTASVNATVVTFNDFSSTAGLTLNGDAAGNIDNGIDSNPVLRLTPADFSQSGSAFSTTTINSATFSTFFQFRITSAGGYCCDGSGYTGADGITFTIQPVSSSIGGGGGGIGYEGITPSVAVEFDTWQNGWDPDTNHVGVDINGSVTSLATVGVPTLFDDGNLWSAWIDYDGTTLEIRANQTGIRPGASLLSYNLDLPSLIGVNDAYVGFTAGTGADYGNHDIISWTYRDEYNPVSSVPEPAALALMGIGLAGLGFNRRKRLH